jgi:hypothetical protein
MKIVATFLLVFVLTSTTATKWYQITRGGRHDWPCWWQPLQHGSEMCVEIPHCWEGQIDRAFAEYEFDQWHCYGSTKDIELWSYEVINDDHVTSLMLGLDTDSRTLVKRKICNEDL